MTPLEARLLLKQLVRDRDIYLHSLMMESIMIGLAEKLGENADIWGIAGLLHDIDYPQTFMNPSRHGMVAEEILKAEGCDGEIIEAIRAHSGNFPRSKKIQFALYAAEALLELITSEYLSESDVTNCKHLHSPGIEKVLDCEKLGFTVQEFSDIIVNILKRENFWSRAGYGGEAKNTDC